ncbi:MAG: hypothetical protein ACLFWF_09220 [Alphaproteobacteria bacterium]
MGAFEDNNYPDAKQFLSVFLRYFGISIAAHIALVLVVTTLVLLVEYERATSELKDVAAGVVLGIMSFVVLNSFGLGWIGAIYKLSIRSVGQVSALGAVLVVLLLFLILELLGLVLGEPVLGKLLSWPMLILMAFAVWVAMIWWVFILKKMHDGKE